MTSTVGARSLLVVVNERSSRSDSPLEDALAVWREAGLEPRVVAVDEARSALEQRDPACVGIVVGGGDGTLHSLAPALLAADLPVGLLPLGTANDFATALGVPASLDAAARVVAEGHRMRVDLGRAGGRPFFNVASVGLAADITRHLSAERKRRFGALSYPLAALERWRRSRPFRVRIECDGRYAERLLSRQVSVANGPRQGGRVVEAQASFTDGVLSLYSVAPQPIWRLLWTLPLLRFGRAMRSAGLVRLRGHKIEIRTRRPRPVSADGELVGRTPMTFEIAPAALEVFVPAEVREETERRAGTEAAEAGRETDARG